MTLLHISTRTSDVRQTTEWMDENILVKRASNQELGAMKKGGKVEVCCCLHEVELMSSSCHYCWC